VETEKKGGDEREREKKKISGFQGLGRGGQPGGIQKIFRTMKLLCMIL
jgi:hypothetical protein